MAPIVEPSVGDKGMNAQCAVVLFETLPCARRVAVLVGNFFASGEDK